MIESTREMTELVGPISLSTLVYVSPIVMQIIHKIPQMNEREKKIAETMLDYCPMQLLEIGRACE